MNNEFKEVDVLNVLCNELKINSACKGFNYLKDLLIYLSKDDKLILLSQKDLIHNFISDVYDNNESVTFSRIERSVRFLIKEKLNKERFERYTGYPLEHTTFKSLYSILYNRIKIDCGKKER